MGLLVHVPFCSLSVWPCSVVPEIVGAAVFTGAPGGTTAALAAEVAGLPEPPALLAVSCTLIVCADVVADGYVCLASVAPGIATQPSPLPSQRSHW